jgi:tetrahydromethanopterin S-methyltransferase subunit G
MTENDLEKIDGMIARRVGTFAESIQHKLDLVVEGQQMLSETIHRVKTHLAQRIDCVEHKLDAVAAETHGNTEAIRKLDARFDTIEIKLDAVAADLSAHRADTEAHRKVYKIKED